MVEYNLKEALDLIKSSAKAKFNESIDLTCQLGVDPRKSTQIVRGTSKLIKGSGKKKL